MSIDVFTFTLGEHVYAISDRLHLFLARSKQAGVEFQNVIGVDVPARFKNLYSVEFGSPEKKVKVGFDNVAQPLNGVQWHISAVQPDATALATLLEGYNGIATKFSLLFSYQTMATSSETLGELSLDDAGGSTPFSDRIQSTEHVDFGYATSAPLLTALSLQDVQNTIGKIRAVWCQISDAEIRSKRLTLASLPCSYAGPHVLYTGAVRAYTSHLFGKLSRAPDVEYYDAWAVRDKSTPSTFYTASTLGRNKWLRINSDDFIELKLPENGTKDSEDSKDTKYFVLVGWDPVIYFDNATDAMVKLRYEPEQSVLFKYPLKVESTPQDSGAWKSEKQTITYAVIPPLPFKNISKRIVFCDPKCPTMSISSPTGDIPFEKIISPYQQFIVLTNVPTRMSDGKPPVVYIFM